MSENEEVRKRFIGYEYKEIPVSAKMEALFTDGYSNFGWTLEDIYASIQKPTSVILKLKRDRKIPNKAEVIRLQRQFESCVSEVESLENSKIIGASVVAYGVGIVGVAFSVGSVLGFNAGMVLLGVLLAVIGLAGWVIPYFAYVRLRNKKTIEVDPLIEQKYDEIYDVCEKASALLNS